MPNSYLSNLIHEIVSKVARKACESDDAAQEDLSYDDALLDVEIRSFLRSEYGKQAPPDGIFPRIMQAIRLYREEQAKASVAGSGSSLERIFGRIGQTLAAGYKSIARPAAGRMISGSLVTALLVLASLPGIVRSLSGGGDLGLSVNALVGEPNSISVEYDNRPGTGAVESATSTATSADIAPAAPVAPGAPPASGGPQTAHISPGRLYEDPRLLLAHLTGEDPNQLSRHLKKQSSAGDPGNDVTNQSGPEQPKNRPVTGQY